MVKLHVFSSVQEADIVKGMLESNGIHAIIQDNNNIYVPTFNGVDMYVSTEDLEKAQILLKSHLD